MRRSFMKWSLATLFSLAFTHQAYAHTEILGDAAKDLYDLIPTNEVTGAGGIANIVGIKVADQVICSKRSGGSYKCLVPNKGPDRIVRLRNECSQIFFDALNQRGILTINLGTSYDLTCQQVTRLNDPNTTYPQCFINCF